MSFLLLMQIIRNSKSFLSGEFYRAHYQQCWLVEPALSHNFSGSVCCCVFWGFSGGQQHGRDVGVQKFHIAYASQNRGQFIRSDCL